MKPDELTEQLTKEFPAGVEALETPFDIPQFRVTTDALRGVLTWLKQRGYAMLLDVGGVDYLPRSPRFEVVYHLLDMERLQRVRLRCSPDDDDPVIPSVSDLWPSAQPAEREVYDLFGVRFEGHPNLTRILMPDDWEGHPLRKDYPLRGPREELEAAYAAQKNRFHAPKLAEDA